VKPTDRAARANRPKLVITAANNPEPASKVVKPAPGKPGKPPVVGHVPTTALCGHVVQVELFDYKKDKFRQERIDKQRKRACKACLEAKHAKLIEEAKARKVMKEQLRLSDSNRLPHGSVFHVEYNAEDKHWSGTLQVPGMKPIPGRESGLFKMFKTMDKYYRYKKKLLEEGEKKENEEVPLQKSTECA
jgi:hypothetical protein